MATDFDDKPRKLPPLRLAGHPVDCEFRLPAEMASEILSMKLAFGLTGLDADAGVPPIATPKRLEGFEALSQPLRVH